MDKKIKPLTLKQELKTYKDYIIAINENDWIELFRKRKELKEKGYWLDRCIKKTEQRITKLSN